MAFLPSLQRHRRATFCLQFRRCVLVCWAIYGGHVTNCRAKTIFSVKPIQLCRTESWVFTVYYAQQMLSVARLVGSKTVHEHSCPSCLYLGPGSKAQVLSTFESPKEDEIPAPDPPSQASQLPLHLTNNHNFHLVMKRAQIQLRKTFQKK